MNALFISYNLFCIDKNSGGRLFSYRNRECLKKAIDGICYTIFITFGNDKDVNVSENEIVLPGAKNKYESLFNYLKKYAMITPKIEKYIINFIKEKNIGIVFFDSSIFGKTIKRISKELSAKTICSMQNVEAYYALNRVRYESKFLYPMYKAYEYNERLAVQYADYVISINKRDALQTEKKYGRKPDKIIHVTLKDVLAGTSLQENTESRKKLELLFIGSNFLPNTQGLRWLVSKVMPYVPAKLTIVGKGMEQMKEELTRENVLVIGEVHDLAQYYLNYDAMILPIFTGSGMKVKTAEAMMYGKVIFATNEALEGYDEIPDKIFRCNTAEEFKKAITYCIETGITKYSLKVRKEFLERYSNQYAEDAYRQIIAELYHE